MTTATSGLIAVTEKMEAAGAMTWWQLSGDVRLSELRAAWEAGNLDPDLLPETLSPQAGLATAVRDQASRHLLARRGGLRQWCLVDETLVANNGIDYQVVLRAWLDAVGRPAFSGGLVGNVWSPIADTDQRVAAIQARFAELTGEKLTAGAMGGWLVRLVTRLGAVALRDRGGVYFVPQPVVGTLQAAARAIGAASSHIVYEVPALKSESAVRAVLDAVQREAEQAIVDMEARLSTDIGERGLTTQRHRAQEALTKVQTYEVLLGENLTGLKERMESLQANIAAAILAAQAEDMPTDGWGGVTK